MAIDLNDKSGNGNTLTNNGAAESASTPFSGSGTSVDLESSESDYLYAADSSSLSITGDMTIELWVYFESFTGGEMTLFSKYETTGNQTSYLLLWNDTGNNLQLYVSNDGTSISFVNFAWTPTVATWYHVAVTYDASLGEAEWFLDGVSQGTASGLFTSIYNGTARGAIGAYNTASTPTSFFDGLIDDVRIWNDIRTSTEISNNYDRELLGTETGLVAYYPFESSIRTPLTMTFSPVTGGYGRLFRFTSGSWQNNHDATIADSGLDGTANIGTNPGFSNIVLRYIACFDTSALPNDAIILSAFVRLIGNGVANSDTDSETIDIVGATPASPTSLALEDYDQLGSTVYGSKTIASYNSSSGVNNDISLNGSGISAISLTGYTQLGLTLERDRSNTAPTGINLVEWAEATMLLSVTYDTPATTSTTTSSSTTSSSSSTSTSTSSSSSSTSSSTSTSTSTSSSTTSSSSSTSTTTRTTLTSSSTTSTSTSTSSSTSSSSTSSTSTTTSNLFLVGSGNVVNLYEPLFGDID